MLYQLSYFGLTAEREEHATRLQSRKLEERLLPRKHKCLPMVAVSRCIDSFLLKTLPNTNSLMNGAPLPLTRYSTPAQPQACYPLGVSPAVFFMKGVNRSIGMGRNVVVLCSPEISRIVWRKRSCRAIGSAAIIAAACTSFSAA